MHGNCWAKRAWATERVEPNGQIDLTAIIRAKLAARRLPCAAALKTWGGYGNGATCDGCGERIALGQLEYEADFAASPTLHFHRECLHIWQKECEHEARGIRGGSAASPCSLFFDFGIARLAGRDPAVHAELLAASREARSEASEMRALTHATRQQATALRLQGDALVAAVYLQRRLAAVRRPVLMRG